MGVTGNVYKFLLVLHIACVILGFGATAFNGLYLDRARRKGGREVPLDQPPARRDQARWLDPHDGGQRARGLANQDGGIDTRRPSDVPQALDGVHRADVTAKPILERFLHTPGLNTIR